MEPGAQGGFEWQVALVWLVCLLPVIVPIAIGVLVGDIR